MNTMLMLLKFFFLISISACCFWFLLSLCLYRITSGSQSEYQGEMHYKFLELNISNRQIFERLVGNKIARFGEGPSFFVSKKDYAKLWPESPHVMAEKGYTIKAELIAKPLVFGGVSTAKVKSVEVINERPKISK